MKRSTIFLIVILVTLVVAPIIYIGLVAKDVKKFTDWMQTEFLVDNDEAFSYKMKITSLDGAAVPDCYMNITTYDGMVVDTLQSVNFVVPADGVTAVLRNDSIVVVLNKVDATVFDGLCLTIELPKNSSLKIENSVPTVDIRLHDADLSTLNIASLSDLSLDDTNIGVLVSIDTTTDKNVNLKDTNIGAMKVNGDNMALTITDGNIGALTVAGTCKAIKMYDSNIGVCSWNKACDEMAVVEDCVITRSVDDGLVKIDLNEDNDKGISVKADVSIEESDEKVEVTPAGVKVQDGDGTNVDISPAGVHVDSDEATVHITPTGLVVKEGDEEIVKIGLGGVKVNNQ